jgi:PEP-CTERM motif
VKFVFLVLLIVLLSVSPGARGQTTFTFGTPANSSTGDGIVSASASFIVSAGQVVITLNDLLARPKSAGQLISGLEFSLPGLTGTTTLSSSSAQQITVNGSGSSTGITSSTGWSFGTFTTGLILCTVCPSGLAGDAPHREIIGPGPYTNANGSITNGSHDPFLNETATFTLTNSSITSAATVSGVIFSFGTTFGAAGADISAAPEPGTLVLFGTGLLILAKIARRNLGPDVKATSSILLHHDNPWRTCLRSIRTNSYRPKSHHQSN